MAEWAASFDNLTPVAVADSADMTSGGYTALKGGSASQMIQHLELTVSGLATASNVQRMVFARDSTVGATLSGGTLTPLNPNSAAFAAPFVQFSTATTKPQRAAGAYLILVAFNAFGGIFRWRVAQGDGIWQFGNAGYTGVGTGGEMSLTSISGVQPISVTHIFKPY